MKAMEREEFFFATFALSFVSIIVLYGRERGTRGEEENMGGRK